jgi:DNA-binding response OmpR family regulator
LGVDGYLIGSVSTALVEQLCDKITGRIVRDSKPYGRIMLKNRELHCGSKLIALTKKESCIFRLLLEASGMLVSMKKLLFSIGYVSSGVKTNAVRTHINRVRKKLEKIDMAELIPNGGPEGYRLILDC